MSESDKQLIRQSSLRTPGSRPSGRRRNRHVFISLPNGETVRPYKTKTKIFLVSLGVLVIVSALAGYLIGSSDYKASKRQFEPPDPVEPQKPSASKLHVFRTSAVCTDSPVCSEIGKKVLFNNGSAVDATIAAMFCNGLLNQQSMGIGGGFFMTVFIKDEEKAYCVNAREKALRKATPDMFGGDKMKSRKGPLAIAVPGELRGLWTAHQHWGKLPWEDLLAPTLNICKEGFIMSRAMYQDLHTGDELLNIREDALIKEQYVSSSGEFHKPGTLIKPTKALCSTLERIARNGGDDFYNGSLAQDLLQDLQSIGSIITAEDLESYEAIVTEPLAVNLGDGDTLYTTPPPSSGAILTNILNILKGYHFSSSSINSTEDKILTYHRIIEAFKYAYALRTKLADAEFVDIKEWLANMTSAEYGDSIRLRINDSRTSNDTATYGVAEYTPPDHGTAHISVLAANGDAVSVTSSINFYFGAGFTALKTGIIMNDVMDDFSSPGFANSFGVRPSPANFIEPGKRPLSSMSPSIIVDKNGNAKMVIGAAGGTKITTAVALVTMRKLWFNQTLKEAVDEPRFHNQIFPMAVQYEFGVTEDILNGLRAKGHALERYRNRGSVVCALYRNRTAIYANSDFRKGGDVAGV